MGKAASNDTLWEDWVSLKATYHLEDKVLLDGLGGHRPKAMDLEDTRGRPKRRTIPPIHLKDYVQVVSWQVGHCVCFICILLAW